MDAKKLFASQPKMLAALKQMKAEKKAKAEEADAAIRRYERLTSKLVPVVGAGFALAVLLAVFSKPAKTA